MSLAPSTHGREVGSGEGDTFQCGLALLGEVDNCVGNEGNNVLRRSNVRGRANFGAWETRTYFSVSPRPSDLRPYDLHGMGRRDRGY